MVLRVFYAQGMRRRGATHIPHAFARSMTDLLMFKVPRLLSMMSAGCSLAGREDRNAAENTEQVTPSITLHIHDVNNRATGYILPNRT